eukprot:8000402-Prorocentrum_lima.AAC.1
MTSSLVGSEMCIRDRILFSAVHSARARCRQATKFAERAQENKVSNDAVSYTHLTLPTICSV